LLAALCAFGQGTTSRLLGTVTDPSGAAVPAATVQLTNEATGATFTTSTTQAGRYVFEAVQPGVYRVTVEAPGFKKFTSGGNQVTIGQPATVNLSLEVGAVTEQIEVTAAAELVQTSASGNFGNLLSGEVIRDLPIVGTRGRNPIDLVLRQPGVVSGANTGGGVHVHGARDRAWNFTLDGIDVNETSAGGSNFAPLRANPDSLAEFRVLTGNFTAEYGRNSGGQVAMITRSGSNEFHGTGFWFYRTPRLNANEWENNLNNVGQRQFVQHIWGGSIGGPVIRNKTFFFANLQRLTARESSVTNRTVYTQLARQGIFRYVEGGRNRPAGTAGASVDAGGNPLPGLNLINYNVVTSDPERQGFDRRVKDLVDKTPLPNNFNGGDGLNTAFYTFTAIQKEKQHDFVTKIDHIFNAKNAVYARIAFGRQDTLCDRVNGGSEFFPGTGCVVNTERNPTNYAFNWRWNPTPSITNEFVFGRSNFRFNFITPTADISKIELASTPVTIPETFEHGNLRELTTWQFVDNLAYTFSAHALKFGTNLRLQRHRDERGSIAGQNATQTVNFSRLINTVDPARFGVPAGVNTQFDRPALESHINFLLGRVGSTARGFPSSGERYIEGVYNFEAKFNEYDFYAQDTWKLRPNLTVDLGLRWEMKLAPRNDEGMIRRPDQAVALGAGSSNTLRWVPGMLYDDDLNNIAPSIGFAWDPFGNGKTSIRSNYRIAYDRIATFPLSSQVFQNLPGITLSSVNQEYGQNGGRLSGLPRLSPPNVDPNSRAQPDPFSNRTITVMDPNFRMPITHQWAFSIQRQIAERTVFEATYLGRRAYGLFGAYNINQAEIFRNGFLDAFKSVQAGGESALMNRLLEPDSRRRLGETGSQMVRRLFASELRNNSVGAVAANVAQRSERGQSIAELAGFGPFFFIPNPQFANAVNVIDSNDFSTYHALELQVERRFGNGLAWQAGYTWSKSLDTRSYDPVFTVVSGGANQSASSTPVDIFNRKLNYAISDFDRTHVFQSYALYELPFGRGKRFGNDAGAFAQRLVGGWQVVTAITLQSGRPFTVYAGSNTISQVVQTTANCSGCTRSDGSVFDDPQQGIKFYFDPALRAKFGQPAPGELGNTGRNFFRGDGWFNMDATFLKRTMITERVNLELRADVTNLTNTPSFGFPTTLFTSAVFGRIRDNVASFSRKIQLGAKINF
ncbi:MAG: TonB-dependent receptor, partial [Acidobacteria bacterium]|nr:TonB-dependent receptor [Acidobacteriota bacterium]